MGQAQILGSRMATDSDRLDAVNSAIDSILSGGAVKSYSIGGRNIQRFSLADLYELRDRLTRSVARSSSTGTRNYAGFREPQ